MEDKDNETEGKSSEPEDVNVTAAEPTAMGVKTMHSPLEDDPVQLVVSLDEARGNFDLQLVNNDLDTLMTAAEDITVAFAVTNNDGNFVLPGDFEPGKAYDDGSHNTVAWSQDVDGEHILTATLAAGQSSVHVAFDTFLTYSEDSMIDRDQTLSLTLKSVDGPENLDSTILVAGDVLEVGGSLEYSLSYDGAEDSQGQVNIGFGGDDATVYANWDNDILIGSGHSVDGHNTSVWTNNMGHGDDTVVDVFKDYQKGDVLHFDELFSSGHGGSVDALLSNGAWTIGERDFRIEDGDTSIHLSIDDTTATLKVAYHDNNGADHSQSVVLEGFGASQFQEYYRADAVNDQEAVTKMLHEIIKVGGNS
jgi:hypothetical protein